PTAREEVANRALDRRLRVVVPVHAQDLVAPAAGRRQPDVLNRAGALDVGKHEGGAGRDRDRRRDLRTLAELARRARAGALDRPPAVAPVAGEVLGADRPRLGVSEPPDALEPDRQSAPRTVAGHERGLLALGRSDHSGHATCQDLSLALLLVTVSGY